MDRSKKVDNEIIKAFFAAEKSLLSIYIQEGKTEELASLIKLFKQINNDTVDKIELTMLGSLLQEKKSQIIQNPDLQQTLRDTFLSFENTVKIHSKHDETIKHSWESAKEILGQLIEEDLTI